VIAEALEGEVAPAEADRLLRATRELGASLRENDESALVRVRERLAELAGDGGGDY
jgi:hypothetical protein